MSKDKETNCFWVFELYEIGEDEGSVDIPGEAQHPQGLVDLVTKPS